MLTFHFSYLHIHTIPHHLKLNNWHDRPRRHITNYKSLYHHWALSATVLSSQPQKRVRHIIWTWVSTRMGLTRFGWESAAFPNNIKKQIFPYFHFFETMHDKISHYHLPTPSPDYPDRGHTLNLLLSGKTWWTVILLEYYFYSWEYNVCTIIKL